MAVRGDFKQLDQLRAKFKDAAGGALKDRLLKAAAAEARTQVQLGFRNGEDPTGAPWRPLKSRKGQPLRKTGRLANSFTARPTSTGFVVGTNTGYAGFHQEGTRYIPKRQMVPSGGSLTPKWRKAIDKAVDVAMRNYLKTK